MYDVARQGRTFLFVSHYMRVVRSRCPRSILLQGGRLVLDGPSADVIAAYNRQVETQQAAFPVRSHDVVIHAFEVRQHGEETLIVDGFLPFEILIDFEVLRDLTLFRIGVYLRTVTGETVFRSLIADWDPSREQIVRGRYRARLEVPGSFLARGNYRLYLHSSRFGILDYLHDFDIEHSISVIAPQDFNRAHMSERIDFAILLRSPWQLEMAG